MVSMVLIMKEIVSTITEQRLVQDFPQGAPTQREGVPTYYLAKICRKLHENEGNWTVGGAHPKVYYVVPTLHRC